MPLPSAIIEQFKAVVGEKNVLVDAAECIAYSYDNSRYSGLPEAVVFASTTEQVAAIVKLCYHQEIPVYARGKGTATTGACVPLSGGVVLSLERMNKIIAIDSGNRVMVAEPGVINEHLQTAAAKQGFFWPPDPSSASTCTLGGNLGCNAAGPRAVKYGTCRENTLGLTVVTGTGEIMHTGVYTTKGVVGFDLTRLLIGSEGTLAIITQANLKLTPLPDGKITLRAIYNDLASCTDAIASIMAQPVTPCALEFMDAASIDMIRNFTAVEIPHNVKALLMIEVDGLKQELTHAAEKIINAATNPGLLDIRAAKNATEVENLWQMRKALSPALKKVAPKKINEDVVVPVTKLTEFIAYTQQLSSEHSLKIVNFGHAGNGNMHTNILLDPKDPQQEHHAELCLKQIFDKVLALKGTLSGEHGVGVDKRPFVSKELDHPSLKIMHGIKHVFDPKNILNPDKLLPEE